MSALLKRIAITLLSLLFFAVVPAKAEENLSSDYQILKEKIEADKKLLIASNMNLTEEEARVFWPVYDDYQTASQTLKKREGNIILTYANIYNAGPVDGEVARALLDEYLELKLSVIKMKQDFASRLYELIPAAKAVRYIQLENKIDAVQAFQISNGIPLVQ